jgi:streptogramin lyase
VLNLRKWDGHSRDDREARRMRRNRATGRPRRLQGVVRVERMEPRCLMAVAINEFLIPTPNAAPAFITTGSDGNLWFTESVGNKIGQINPTTHNFLEFPLTTVNSFPQGIVTGSDTNLWFTEEGTDTIATMNPATHSIVEFPIPKLSTDPFTASKAPFAITAGSDNNLWFTELLGNKVATINPTTHVFTEFVIPTPNSLPEGITAGPDRNIWFVENNTNKIAVFNLTTKAITEFVIPTANSRSSGITTGTDGNLWFTEGNGNKIGQFNPTTHAFAEFAVPTANSQPLGITSGPDGNLWFAENLTSKVGSINPTSHAIQDFVTPSANSGPFFGITPGPDGNVWFVERNATRIGQILLNTNLQTTVTQLTAFPNPATVGQNVTFTATVSLFAGQEKPNGTVTFTIDGTAQAPVLLLLVNGQQQATFSTSTLAAGSHQVVASYNGLGLWLPSTSNAVTEVVNNIIVATSTVLTSSVNPSTVGQQVAFTATVTPSGAGTPTGTVTFSIDGQAQTPVPLALVNGKQRASFFTSSLSAGSHKIVAVYNGDGGLQPSASNALTQQVNVPPGDGPHVSNLQRFGLHQQPTTLVLTFTEALNTTPAQNVNNYTLLTATQSHGIIRTGRKIRITRAVYDPNKNTVTLFPAERLVLRLLYQLTVNGQAPNGLTDTQERLLDGNGSGQPGSNFVAIISQSTFAGPNPH